MQKRIVSCDWGTSTFRIRLVDPVGGEVLCERTTREGISVLDQSRESLGLPLEARAAYLCRYLDGQLESLSEASGAAVAGLPVLVSGMASSNLGIRPLPYASVPFRLDGRDAVWERLAGMLSGGGVIYLCSGVSSGHDMLRGEEAELIGISRLLPSIGQGEGTSLVVLPGTHSKHLGIQDSCITAIDTYLTGELFSLLSQHGLLRNAVREGMDFEEGQEAFLQGVMASGDAPLLRALFSIRARQVLQAVDPALNHHYLSGLLIGHELRALPAEREMTYLCAGAGLEAPYRAAMEALHPGHPVVYVPLSLMARAIAVAHGQLFQTMFLGSSRGG